MQKEELVLKRPFATYVGLRTLNSLFCQNELHLNAEKEIQEARSELETKFRLSNNADILLSRADELYTQCRFKECLEVTTNIQSFLYKVTIKIVDLISETHQTTDYV
ncbi:7639_t:CDS:2, partial [Racocetra fulgida]